MINDEMSILHQFTYKNTPMHSFLKKPVHTTSIATRVDEFKTFDLNLDLIKP